MNGDLVTQADVGSMLEYHGQGGFDATVGVRQYSHSVPFGCIEVREGRVTMFEEKPTITRLVNAGIYILEPALLARVPGGEEFALPTLIEECLAQDRPVGAYEIREDWIDVGRPVQLREAREGAIPPAASPT
jgi:NDP-sugar pyrophosphorylase family protein